MDVDLKIRLINRISRRLCGLIEDNGSFTTIKECANAIRVLAMENPTFENTGATYELIYTALTCECTDKKSLKKAHQEVISWMNTR